MRHTGRLSSAALAAALVFLVVLPVGVLMLGAFLQNPPRALQIDFRGAGLQHFRALFATQGMGAILRNTLIAALAASAIAVAAGTLMAWLVVRTNVRFRGLLDSAAIMPMYVSPLVGALAWSILGSPQAGLLNLAIKSLGFAWRINIYSLGGIIFVLAIYYAPYVYLYLSTALKSADPTLEEAAVIHGLSQFRTMLSVTLPLMIPALVSASVMVLVLTLQLFAVPAVLGAPVGIKLLSPYIYDLMSRTPTQVNQAAAVGVILLAVTVLLVLAQQWLLGRRRYVTVTGKGLRPRTIDLGRWRPAATSFGLIYLFISVVMPYAALLLVAFRKNMFLRDFASLFQWQFFGLDHWRFLINNPTVIRSIGNSLVVGGGAALLGVAFYFLVAYAVVKVKVPGHRLIDLLAMVPVAVPGILMGIGFLWAWIALPIGIYGTLMILILAYVAQFTPQGVRLLSSSLMQVHEELEESARIHGASYMQTIFRVLLPLIRHGLFATFVQLFVLSVRELATALFLYTTGSIVISVALFDLWSRGVEGPMAALALVQSLLLLAAVGMGRRFLGSDVTLRPQGPAKGEG